MHDPDSRRRECAKAEAFHISETARVPKSYAGEFENGDWGVLTMSAQKQAVNARIGALPLPIRLTSVDRFMAGDYTGRFELDAKGNTSAVWLWMAPPDSVRFERRH